MIGPPVNDSPVTLLETSTEVTVPLLSASIVIAPPPLVIVIPVPAVNVCVGDDDGAGGTITQEQIDESLEIARAAGANCN